MLINTNNIPAATSQSSSISAISQSQTATMTSSTVKKEDEEKQRLDPSDDLLTTALFKDDDVVVLEPPDDQFATDEISSPITAEIFDFCDNELFPSQTLTTSEAASCSNCCHEENSYYSASMSLPHDVKLGSGYDDNDINTPPATTTATVAVATMAEATDNHCSNFPMIFHPQNDMDNDIAASMNFAPCGPFSVPPYLATASQENQFDASQMQPQMVPNDPGTNDVITQYSSQVIGPLMATHPLQPVFEDECLSSVPSFVCMNPSASTAPPCNLLDLSLGPYLLDNFSPTLSAADSFVGSNLFMGSEIQQPQSLGCQEDCNSYFCPGSIPRGFYSGDIQSLCSETATPWIGSGVGNSNPSATSDITHMEESSYKVGKLSVEQRKEKIHRYMKKRNERNFNKKIKYACRKTLADSRPRVRGRFAKNDEYGSEQSFRANYSHHEDDEDDDITVKQEDELLGSSDIYTHISGVNSFNYNFPVQSWT